MIKVTFNGLFIKETCVTIQDVIVRLDCMEIIKKSFILLRYSSLFVFIIKWYIVVVSIYLFFLPVLLTNYFLSVVFFLEYSGFLHQ
jgi:hypothetical protein